MREKVEYFVKLKRNVFVMGYCIDEDDFTSVGLCFSEKDAIKIIDRSTAAMLANKIGGIVVAKTSKIIEIVEYEEVDYNDIT